MGHEDLLGNSIGKRLFKTSNDYLSSVDNPTAGICSALTARWIKRGLEKKLLVLEKDPLGRIFRAVELQKKTLQGAIKNNNFIDEMLTSQRLIFAPVKNGEFKNWDEAAKALTSKTGFVYFTVSKPKTIDSHTMGIHIAKDLCIFFDPNLGIYSYSKLEDLTSTVAKHLMDYPFIKNGAVVFVLYHITGIQPKEEKKEVNSKNTLGKAALEYESIILSLKPDKGNLKKEFARYESALLAFWLSRYINIKNGKESKGIMNKFKTDDLKKIREFITETENLQKDVKLKKTADEPTKLTEESILHGLLSKIGLKHKQTDLKGAIEPGDPQEDSDEIPPLASEDFKPLCKAMSNLKTTTGCLLVLTPTKCMLVCMPQSGLPGYYPREKSIMEASAGEFWEALEDQLCSEAIDDRMVYSIHEIKEL